MAMEHILSSLVLCIVWCEVFSGSAIPVCKKASWKNGTLAAGAPEGSVFPYDYPAEQGWTVAHMTDVRDFVIDESGNIYIADAGPQNNGIVKWAANSDEGVVLLGGGAGQWSQFGAPESLLLTNDGDLIICDSGYHRIQRFSPKTNASVTLVNNVDCRQLFTNQNGDLLFSTSTLTLFKWLPEEKRAQMVMKPAGKILPSVGKGSRMFLSQNGNVYITDPQNNRILKYTSGENDAEIIAGGQTWQSSAQTNLDLPVSVIADDRGVLFIGNAGTNQVIRWDVADSAGVVAIKQPNVGYNFLVRFDRNGNMYAASYTSIVRHEIDASACAK